MNIDIDFLRKTAAARHDVGEWLHNRPKIGLDVTDVATLCSGFDYLIDIIKDITGEDLIGHRSVQVTYLDIEQ